MSQQQHIKSFILAIEKSLEQQTFIKISLSNYKGPEADLKQIIIKKVLIKEAAMLSFTHRYKTRDTIKNFSIKVGLQMITTYLQSEFHAAILMCTAFDLQFQILGANKAILRKRDASILQTVDASHDKKKVRHLQTSGKNYLHDLKIISAEGQVYKDAQDKFKQINHYIELLRVMIKNLPKYDCLHVYDMGAGKGYLTFALYDYLVNKIGINANVNGIEFREDLVKLCNEIADKNSFSNLHFFQGSIEDFELEKCNILIALHACDTATDDAIIKGILASADLILVSPCCHKQIRREMAKANESNILGSVLKHGIYLERQAEMVTDSLRALVLEKYGYKVKVFDFISTDHTPKNIMIAAEKMKGNFVASKDTDKKISDLMKVFEINSFYLSDSLGKTQ